MLVLWSEHFRESAWCAAETILADFLRIRIVPVITDATPLDALLKPYQAVDLRRGGTIDYDVLLQAITGRLDPAEDFAWDPRRSPFPGLESFGSGDAAVYFGREEELAAAHACLPLSVRCYEPMGALMCLPGVAMCSAAPRAGR